MLLLWKIRFFFLLSFFLWLRRNLWRQFELLRRGPFLVYCREKQLPWMTPLESRCHYCPGKVLGEKTHIWMSRSDTRLIVGKEVTLSGTNLDWLRPSSSAFLTQEISQWKICNALIGACLLHNGIVQEKKTPKRKDPCNCVEAVLCKCFLSHGYGNSEPAVEENFLAPLWVWEEKGGVLLTPFFQVLLRFAIREMAKNVLWHFTLHIRSDVGRCAPAMEGEVSARGADGSHRFANLPLLNISSAHGRGAQCMPSASVHRCQTLWRSRYHRGDLSGAYRRRCSYKIVFTQRK